MSNPSVAQCPKNVAIPVIFIPGIMGSRLRYPLKNTGGKEKIVWQPGIESWEQIWHTLGLSTSGAEGKRELLVGGSKQYFNPGYLEVAHHPDGALSDHGFNGLLPSYLPFMNWLNGQQNQIIRID